MKEKDYYNVRLEPYKVSGSALSGLKITLPKITLAKKGDKYYILKDDDGVILLVPEKKYFSDFLAER